ncbi:hypothetical protein [Yoonia sp.]|uniref:hypothetical protein n=1 Tax=Yoonia sp. TaxID=2212373 RepID=UPI003F6B8237
MTDTAFVIRRFGRSAPLPDSRYEYRVWPRSPNRAVSLLHRFWPLTDAERRSDIYLVHPASDRTLIKLRDGRQLEIKCRAGDVAAVQHWTMPVSTEFPLTTAQLADLAAALSLQGRMPAAAGLSPAHLLAALDALDVPVIPQTVQKSRLLFRKGSCRAEICRVSVAGWRGLTVALEAAEFSVIAAALDDLHLRTLPNRSYGEALARFASLHARCRKLPAT